MLSLTFLLYLCLLCLGFCRQDLGFLFWYWGGFVLKSPPNPQRAFPFIVDLASYAFFIGLAWWRSHWGMLWIPVSHVLDLISPFGAILVFAVIGWPSAPGLQLRLTFRSAVAFLAKHLSSGNSGFVSSCIRPRSLCCIYTTTPQNHTAHTDGVIIWVWLKQMKCLYTCLIFSCPRPFFWKPWTLLAWNI